MNNIKAAGVAGGAGNDPEVRWTRSWTVRSWRSCMAVSHLRAKLLKSSGYKGPADPWAPRPLVVAFLDFVTVGASQSMPDSMMHWWRESPITTRYQTGSRRRTGIRSRPFCRNRS